MGSSANLYGGDYFRLMTILSREVQATSNLIFRHLDTGMSIFAGQQAFRRNGFPSSDPVFGGSASFGFKPTRYVSLELSVEGSNLAIGTSTGAGFNYFVLSPRILFRF